MDESQATPTRVVIKRYANRKLYDTQASRYVTLQQIAERVKAGDEVQIIDNTTKEDLTRVTLAQILYERERASDPEERRDRSLRELLREGRERLLESFRESPVLKLVQRGEGEEPAGEPVAPAEEPEKRESKRPAIASPREALDELGRLADEQWRSLLDTALHTVQQLQGEVQRLSGRIEELETRLGAKIQAKKDDDDTPP